MLVMAKHLRALAGLLIAAAFLGPPADGEPIEVQGHVLAEGGGGLAARHRDASARLLPEAEYRQEDPRQEQ